MIKQLCGVALGALLALGASPGFAATASFTGPATGNTCQYDTATIFADKTDASVTVECKTGALLTAELLKKENASSCDYDKVDVDSNGKLSVTCSNKPTCTLSASPSSVASGGPSTLTATCTPTAISYQWTGDGCTQEKTASCKVTPTIDTPYTVSAIYSDGQTSNPVEAKVTITSTATTAPVCSVSQNQPNPVTTGSVSLTAECTPAATKGYVWTGGECIGGNTGQTCALITPSVKTTYSVIGTNSFGNSKVASATVEVSSTPTTPPPTTFKCSLSASPASISAGESSTLAASCPAGASYTWSGASCSGATCPVTPTATTTYTVTGKLGAATSSADAKVTVVPKATTAPVCKVSQNPGNPVTTGSVRLTAECEPPATSYAWTGGQCLNGNTEQTCSLLTPGAKTTYSVIGTNSFGNSNTAGATVEVSSSTSHVCTLSATHSTVTLGQTVTLTVTCPGDMLSYTWSAITSCSGNSPICLFTPKEVGTPSYNVRVDRGFGIEDTPSTSVTVTPAKLVCTLKPASPLTVTAGNPVTLTADCGSSPGTTYSWSNNTFCTDRSKPTCEIKDPAETTYTVKGSNADVESDLLSVTVKFTTSNDPSADRYQGLWWNPQESGWGISLTQQANKIFAAIYTYDAAGQPTWYVMSACPITADKPGSCTGTIHKVTGGSTPFKAWVGPVKLESDGTGTFTFSDANHGQFDYTFKDGVKRSKAIEKFTFAGSTQQFEVDYTNLWMARGEDGWGVALTQDKGRIFAALYAYKEDGTPIWYFSMCDITGTAGSSRCNSDLVLRTGGAPLTTSPWTMNKTDVVVGEVTFKFSSTTQGEMVIAPKSGSPVSKIIAPFGF